MYTENSGPLEGRR